MCKSNYYEDTYYYFGMQHRNKLEIDYEEVDKKITILNYFSKN